MPGDRVGPGYRVAAHCLEQIDRGIQPILNRQYVGVLHVQGVALGIQHGQQIGGALDILAAPIC